MCLAGSEDVKDPGTMNEQKMNSTKHDTWLANRLLYMIWNKIPHITSRHLKLTLNMALNLTLVIN